MKERSLSLQSKITESNGYFNVIVTVVTPPTSTFLPSNVALFFIYLCPASSPWLTGVCLCSTSQVPHICGYFLWPCRSTVAPAAPITKSSSVGGEICSLGRNNDDDDDDKKRRSSFGARMMGMVGLGKKSQSASQLNPEGEYPKTTNWKQSSYQNQLLSQAGLMICRPQMLGPV